MFDLPNIAVGPKMRHICMARRSPSHVPRRKWIMFPGMLLHWATLIICVSWSSWRSQKKHDAHTLDTCLSRLRSAEKVTPSMRMWSNAVTVISRSVMAGPCCAMMAGCTLNPPTVVTSYQHLVWDDGQTSSGWLLEGTIPVTRQWPPFRRKNSADIHS